MAYPGPQSNDIRATLTITQAESMSGTSRSVNLPGGRQVTVPIPPGIYNGQEITLPGQGEQTWNGGPSGNLILTITVAPTSNYPVNQGGSDAYLPTERASQGSISPPPPASGVNYPYTNYPPQSPVYPSYADAQPAYAPPPYGGEQPSAYSPSPYGNGQPSMYPQYGEIQSVPQMTTAPKRRLSGGVIFLVTLLILVLVGATFSYVFLTRSHQNQQTGGNGGSGGNNVTPVPSTTPDLYTQATSGSPAISSTLTAQDGNNWDEDHQTSGDSCAFANSQYHAISGKAQNLYPCYMASVFSNFAFVVQMTITQGDYGGIIFRADSVNSHYYYFRIGQDGKYALTISTDNTFSGDHILRSGDASSIFKTGRGQMNEVSVIANGTTISVYVNHKFLDKITDSTYAAGRIGVFAGDNASPTADVAYSNAKLWTL